MRPFVALFALALVAVAAAAPPPPTAAVHTAPPVALAAWAGNETTASHDPVEAGSTIVAWFAARSLNDSNATRFVLIDIASTVATFAPTQLNVTLPPNATDWATANVTIPTATNVEDVPSFSYNATFYEVTENGTVVLQTVGGSGPLVVGAVVAPGPAIPLPWLIGGGFALLVAVAVGAYVVRERNLRRRMRGQARSQVMRELELEQKLEKAREKDPEAAVQIKQEIRQQEQVREKRRELQILEAKRADVVKTMDLLKKRHEMGGLSKLQYDNMVAKKQQDLDRIEAEIAEMERQDRGAAA